MPNRYIVLTNCHDASVVSILRTGKENLSYKTFDLANAVASTYLYSKVVCIEEEQIKKEEKPTEKDLSLAIGDLVLGVIKYLKKM